MSGTPIVDTQRLLLRRWRPADLAPLAAMGQDPRVMRNFPALLTAGESQALMERLDRHFDAHGFGAFAVERRDTGAFIGVCGCKTIDWPHAMPSPVEIGWRFAAEAWGQGFATEAARAALDHCFAVSGLAWIACFTVPRNMASWRVMERLGMERRPDLDFDHPRVPDGHVLKRHIVYLAAPPPNPSS
jgi:ribosomal-protein-alanine N-acetyltransferase